MTIIPRVLSDEGRFMRRLLRGGMRRLRTWLAPTDSGGTGNRPGPLRGSAFNGWTWYGPGGEIRRRTVCDLASEVARFSPSQYPEARSRRPKPPRWRAERRARVVEAVATAEASCVNCYPCAFRRAAPLISGGETWHPSGATRVARTKPAGSLKFPTRNMHARQRRIMPVACSSSPIAVAASSTLIVVMPIARAGFRLTPRSSR